MSFDISLQLHHCLGEQLGAVGIKDNKFRVSGRLIEGSRSRQATVLYQIHAQVLQQAKVS